MVPIDHFDTAVSLFPDAPAIVDGSVTLTFAQVARASHTVAMVVAAAAANDGLTPVAIYSPNDYRFLIAMIGVMRAGGVVVPVHASNPVDVTLKFLRQVQSQCVFYHSSLSQQIERLRTEMPSITDWISLDELLDAESIRTPCLSDVDYRPDWIDASGNRDRPVYYWATSGTTGEPKVVVDDVVTFDGAMAFVRALPMMKANRFVSLAIAPLSHGAGPHSFAILAMGGMVIVVRQFDAIEILSLIETRRVTDMWLSPTALYLLLESQNTRPRDLSSLRYVQLGTAAVSPDRLKQAISAFGPCVGQTYGQIETGFVTTLEPDIAAAAARGEHPERLSSAGRSAFVNQVAIMAPDGRLLAPGESGEVVVRGRCVKRYLDDTATREARRFGWHHTGDIGYLDESGFLFISGRLRDVVNMAGLKIPAAELEHAIMEIPEVRECAVVAVPDPLRGEVPRAIVSLQDGESITSSEVIAHCRQRTGAARAPASVEFWTELPKSPAGKIDKLRIRALVAAN